MEKIIQEIKKIEINTYVLLQLKECIDESVKERIENNEKLFKRNKEDENDYCG